MKKFTGYLFCLISILFLTSCSKKLPEEAKQLFAQNPFFTSNIYLSVPAPDQNSDYERILNASTIVDNSLIPQVGVSVGGNKDALEYDKHLLSFLINERFLEIKTATQTTINRYDQQTQRFNFSIYSPSANQFLIQTNDLNSKYAFKIAGREFKSIFADTYEKKELNGQSVKVYSFDFTYSINPYLEGFQSIKDFSFHGTAKGYQDPSTENWVFTDIVSGDNGQNQFLDVIHTKYQPYMTPEEIAASRVNKIRAMYPCLNVNSYFTDDIHFIGYFEAGMGSIYTLSMTYNDGTNQLTVDNSNAEPFDCDKRAKFVIQVN